MSNATFKAFQDRAGIYDLAASGVYDGAYNTMVSAEAMQKLDLLCPEVSVPSSVFRFAGLKGIPELVPFDGEVKYAGVDQWTVTTYTNEYAVGVSIRYRDFQNDQKNMDKYMTNVPAYLAVAAVKQRFQLMASLVEGNPTWQPDGKAIYADDHDFGDNNISVDVSSPTSPTSQDWQTVIDAVITQFGTFTNDLGNPLTEDLVASNLLALAPSKYSASLRRIGAELQIPRVFGTNTAAASVNNIDTGTIKALCSPRLTSSNNVIYFVLGNEDYSMIGANAGTGPAFSYTMFTPYQFMTNAGDAASDKFRNNLQIESRLYGECGVTCIAAQRTMKVTLT